VQAERHDWHMRKPNVNDAAGMHLKKQDMSCLKVKTRNT
jgi:hypothetical protein